MDLVTIVILVALIEYMVFGMLVGKARAKTGIKAPATSGDPEFECYYRVQQNTLELLIAFVPSILIFAQTWRADIAAGLGALFIIGRFVYLRAYVADPGKRGLGFVLSWLPTIILLIGGLVGVIMRMM